MLPLLLQSNDDETQRQFETLVGALVWLHCDIHFVKHSASRPLPPPPNFSLTFPMHHGYCIAQGRQFKRCHILPCLFRAGRNEKSFGDVLDLCSIRFVLVTRHGLWLAYVPIPWGSLQILLKLTFEPLCMRAAFAMATLSWLCKWFVVEFSMCLQTLKGLLGQLLLVVSIWPIQLGPGDPNVMIAGRQVRSQGKKHLVGISGF